MNTFKECIDRQIEYNRGKNIFLDKPEIFRFIDGTIDVILNINESDAKLEEYSVNYACDKAIEEFCRVNQYYYFDTKSRENLKNIYSYSFESIRTRINSIDEISKNHYKNLKEWIIECNPFAEKIYSGVKSRVEPVACSEYSSDLQVKMLQIESGKLKEPVLDIGCGRKGGLVHYLIQKGIETYGIDRFSSMSNNFYNCDWLKYDYGVEKWGTIISNLGFSNHFKHHNLRENGSYIEYAKKYMEILKSLKVMGEFYYMPDLPFIEQYLDSNQYQIDKNEIGKFDFKVTKIKRLK